MNFLIRAYLNYVNINLKIYLFEVGKNRFLLRKKDDWKVATLTVIFVVDHENINSIVLEL